MAETEANEAEDSNDVFDDTRRNLAKKAFDKPEYDWIASLNKVKPIEDAENK